MRMLRLVRPRVVVFALALVALGGVGARIASRRFVFRGWGSRSTALPSDVRPLVVAAPDGARVFAAELVAEGRPYVVHFHNNRETIADVLPFARALHDRGVGVVLVEYRGYGASRDLSPSEDAEYEDAAAVLDALERRGIGPDRVVLSGRSLGTGIAAEMARRGRGAALVLVSPYTSIPDLVRDAVPLAPDLLVEDAFDTGAKASAIHVPTLIVHGDADEIVPFAMGAALASAIDGATLLAVAGARHDDVLQRDVDRTLDAIADLALRR